jgi:3-oxoadipate enol-lactonase
VGVGSRSSCDRCARARRLPRVAGRGYQGWLASQPDTLPRFMPTIQAGGQTLYYELHGEGEPLLCVMGLAADALAWTLQVPAFSARHHTVIFDNRDVGRSSLATRDYEITDMAKDAFALADALELDSFHLLGASMGGAIGQEMALAAPDRIRTLTLAVTFAAGGAYAHKLSQVWGARVHKLTLEERVDELMLLCHSEEFFENADAVATVRGVMLENPHPQPPEAFARQLAACIRHDTRDRLGSLSMPVHVIGAERDILVPVWKSTEIASLIPGAELTVIERSPHGLNIERAEEFNRAVLDFIAERTAAPA